MDKTESTLEGWAAVGADVKFDQDDFEILDLTLHLIPELRICAMALKRARKQGIEYPIKSAAELSKLLEQRIETGCGRSISSTAISKYTKKEFFPIEHEGHLVSTVYLGLMICRTQMAVASPTTPKSVQP
jgi:hypothetical protein